MSRIGAPYGTIHLLARSYKNDRREHTHGRKEVIAAARHREFDSHLLDQFRLRQSYSNILYTHVRYHISSQ
ncbi:hypothetical protein UFOVP1090_6 [uncultured Caudovirales phage]|uniref:Uncharacterized protein n=1 Tax=uncultured Caudovirales phage TaxID=2100421 RepID=A0A6J5QIY9_9CAUD|nr:hypothetical protein UFOVP1090_6 [uncultured Caudovirales phage]